MVTALALIFLAPLLLVDLIFVGEAIAGLAPSRRRNWPAPDGRTVIVIPAHDEERGIGATLAGLVDARPGGFDILVIADNCTDRTAAIARSFPVTVAERRDPHRRGKGFALAFAAERLREGPAPAAVIVLDSDCHTDRASLSALAGACIALRRPVQAINLLEPSPGAGAMVQVSGFAFLFKNLIRQRGLQRLAGTVHLTGTGMALPWPLFDAADLATASIVEDIRLGIELARAGSPPTLVDEAIVWSPHAARGDTLTQRSRWEGGYLSLARAMAPRLILDGLRSAHPRRLAAGLDLLIPPLALLGLANVGAAGLALLLAAVGVMGWLPAALTVGAAGLVALVILIGWWLHGRAQLSASALLRLPLYMLWKLPMYAGLARSGAPSAWQRTARPPRTAGEDDRPIDRR